MYIKSRANILTRVQSEAYTEPISFSSLFNLPYSKDIHYFSQARHIAHSTTQYTTQYITRDHSQCLSNTSPPTKSVELPTDKRGNDNVIYDGVEKSNWICIVSGCKARFVFHDQRVKNTTIEIIIYSRLKK